MVELTNLPLVLCTEDIRNVNISGAMKIKSGHEYTEQSTNLLRRYQNRPLQDESLSFCEFVHQEFKATKHKKTIVPHFVGMSSSPTYPPSIYYARAALIIHIPWRKAEFYVMSDADCLHQFQNMMKSKLFPASVIMAYNKCKQQYLENKLHTGPVQKEESYDDNDEGSSKEEHQLIRALSSFTSNMSTRMNINGTEYNRGIHYDWSKRIKPVSETKT